MLPFFLALAAITKASNAQSCPAGSLPSDQLIQWTPCPVDTTTAAGYPYYAPTLECGTVEVPLDYTNASSEALVLPVVRIPANSSDPVNQTIIYNPGGPGSSGIQSLIDWSSKYQVLTGNAFHLVSFDPRGVGLTRPYSCPTIDALGYSIDYSYLPLDDSRGLNATYTSEALQGEVCAQSPYLEDGELVGTAAVARDINAIAEALGEDGLIRYWGISYGTLLGSTLAAMFPEKIDRMVLDGNINPTDYYHGPGDEAADDVDREMTYFFDTCAAAGFPNCPLAGTTVTGEVASGALLQSTFYDWLEGLKNGTYVPVDPNDSRLYFKGVKSEIFQNLYSAKNFPDMAALIAEFYTNSTLASSISRRQESTFDPTAALGEEFPTTLAAVTCGEWDEIPAGDLNDFKDLLGIYEKRSYFGGDQLIGIVFSCATWNITTKEKFGGAFEGIQTKTPILFVNSDKDPVTPLVSAQNSSSGFVDSVVLQHNGAGHGSSSHPSNCVQEKITSYWLTGVMPDVSEICEPNVQPFMGDLDVPVNISRPVGNTTTDLYQTEEYNRAVASLAHFNPSKVKRDALSYDFFPVELLKLKNKRSVSNSRVLPRQATSTTSGSSTSASCTPITAVTPSSSSDSGRGSGNENAAGRQSIGGGLLLTLLLGVGMLIL